MTNLEEKILDFYEREYGDGEIELDKNGDVYLAYTTDDDENEIQVTIDVQNEKMKKYFNNQLIGTYPVPDLEEVSFDELTVL